MTAWMKENKQNTNKTYTNKKTAWQARSDNKLRNFCGVDERGGGKGRTVDASLTRAKNCTHPYLPRAFYNVWEVVHLQGPGERGMFCI
jgi:hypothetical protein